MAYKNVKQSEKFGGQWWQAEWQDATGTWYFFDGIWGTNKQDAENYIAKKADEWSIYTHDPVQAKVYYDQIMEDARVWGCE